MQKFRTIILLIVLAVSMYCAPISIGKSYNPIVVEATTLEEDLSLWKEDWLSIYSSNEEMIRTYHIMDEYSKRKQQYINFYTAFFENEISSYCGISTIYIDCSYSMDRTFFDGKEKILQNLDQFVSKNELCVKEVFKNTETHLYSLIDLLAKENMNAWENGTDLYNNIIVTDLFDTGNNIDETLKSVTFCNTLICCVPYESTNKEAVLHCETFANKVLDKGLWLQSAVYIVYTDEVVIEYHNRDWQFGGGGINIYIP